MYGTLLFEEVNDFSLSNSENENRFDYNGETSPQLDKMLWKIVPNQKVLHIENILEQHISKG